MNLGAMAIKKYSEFPKAPVLLEPHHQTFKFHIRTLVGEVLHIGREAVGVFCSPSRLGHEELVFFHICTFSYIYIYIYI